MAGLRKKDLEAMIGFLGDAQSIQGPSPFTRELLDGMARIFDCEYATYNELDFARRAVISYVPCSAEDGVVFEMAEVDWDELAADLILDRKVEQNGIATTSDLYSREQRVNSEVGYKDDAENGILDTMCARIGPPVG